MMLNKNRLKFCVKSGMVCSILAFTFSSNVQHAMALQSQEQRADELVAAKVTDPKPAPAPAPAPAMPPQEKPKSAAEKPRDFSRIASPKGAGRWSNRILLAMPSRAIREGHEGTVGFGINVGLNGRVAGCYIKKTSGHSILDEALCKGMRRFARFNPALNKRGAPTLGTWSSNFTYRIPPPPPKPSNQPPPKIAKRPIVIGHIPLFYPSRALREEKEGSVDLLALVTETGAIASCMTLKSSGHEILDRYACKELERAQFSPAIDINGKPAQSVYMTTITYDLGKGAGEQLTPPPQ